MIIIRSQIAPRLSVDLLLKGCEENRDWDESNAEDIPVENKRTGPVWGKAVCLQQEIDYGKLGIKIKEIRQSKGLTQENPVEIL